MIPRVAVPRAVLEGEKTALAGMFELEHYGRIGEVLVVDGMMGEEEEGEDKVQRPWEWIGVPGGETLVWDHQRRGYQRQEGWEGVPEADEFAALVEKASVNIDEGMAWTGEERLEVRLVGAVRK